MLVEAPRANVTSVAAPEEIRDIYQHGLVYSCPISSFTDDCRPLELYQDGTFSAPYIMLVPWPRYISLILGT